MKKKNSFGMLKRVAMLFVPVIALVISCLGMGNAFADEGRDISDYINVDSLVLTLPDSTVVDTQIGASASTDPESYTVDAATVNAAVLTLSMQLPDGGTLQNGDHFTVEVQTHITGNALDLSFPSSTGYVGLSNGNVNIGQWRVEDGNIVGVFNENAVGMSVMQPFELAFLDGSIKSWQIGYARVGQITIGDKTFYFKISGQNLHRLIDARWQSGAFSNNYVSWAYRIGTSLSNSLLSSNGASGDTVDSLFEDSYEEATNVSIGRIQALLPAPLTLENGSVGASFGYTFNIESFFTEVTQREGETYDSFKARVARVPLQYGVYKSSDGLFSVVVYFGEIGTDGPLWRDIDENYINSAVDKIISNGYYPEEQSSALANRLTESFGRNSLTHEAVATFNIFVSATYPLALEERTLSSDAIYTYDGVPVTMNGSATLVGISSSIEVSSFSAKLVQADAESGEMVSGGTYKLQLKGQDGEYTDYKASDGGELIRTVEDDGTIEFANLGVGVYRFAQVTPPEGYSRKQSEGYDEEDGLVYSEDFEIHADDEEGVIVLMQIKEGIDEEEEEDILVPDTGAFSSTGEDFVNNVFGVVLVGCGIIGGAVLTYFAYRIVRRKMFD
jgi:hypothetical protein